MKHQLSGLALLGSILAVPAVAAAYCQTTTCAQQNPPAECNVRPDVGTCQTVGLPLRWTKPCVSFSVQTDGSKKLGITADQLQEVVRTSFDNWQNATCTGGGMPNMAIDTYPQVECNESRYNQNDHNQNVWLFRDDSWPHEGGGDRTIALTLVSFSPKTGEIYDVDVELNSFQRSFTLESPIDAASSVPAGDDLQSVVQHESGHFLGLAHSDSSQATMWANYSGSLDMRTLEPDDMDGICSIYPPVASASATCDAEPRHGFSRACSSPPDSGCSMAASDPQGTQRSGLLFLAASGLLLLTRHGRRRSADQR